MRNRRVLQCIVIILMLYAQTGDLRPYPATDFGQDTPYRVLKVVDGDIIKIVYDGKPTDVHLRGVGTPETRYPSKPPQPYGKEAKTFLENLLKGESVYLRFDRQKTDGSDWFLAYVYRAPDGLFVNLEVIRQGYGRLNLQQVSLERSEIFKHYANHARVAGKGFYTVLPLGGRVDR